MPAPARPRGLLLRRDFGLFQAARFLAVVGVQMQVVAVGWQVYALTRRPLDLGWVGLAQFVPAAGLALVAGHAADRYDRRRIVLVCWIASAACSAALFGLARAGIASPWPIYAVLVVMGAVRAFAGPANQALLTHLVEPAQLGGAVALGSSIWMVASIAGPALGGAVYAWAGGAGAVYASTTALVLSGAALVGAMRVRTGRLETAEGSWRTLLAGVGYVWRKRVRRGSISLDLFAVLLGGAVALLPVYASDVLHAGPSGLGILRAAPGAGAAIVGAALAIRPLRRHAGNVMLACVAVFGLATVVFGLSRSFPLSVAALAVAGAADMVSVVVRLTLVQVATPPEMRGRVSAVNLVFVGASNELGEFESGLTAAWLGVVPAVVAGGLGTCAVVAVWAWLFPELRTIDRLDETDAQSSRSAPVAAK